MRKSKIVIIESEGRDRGKSFLVTEMSAARTEEWAAQALLALGRSGVEVPDEAMDAGAAAVLSAGISAFRQIAWADAKPLFDQMMECVSFVPDPAKRDPLTAQSISRPLIDDDIEEVSTRLKLRGEVLELHLGFSLAGALSSLGAADRQSTSRTPTSRKSSGRSSAKGSRRSTNSKRSTG